MFLCRVLSEFLTWTTVSGTLKLHENSTCISWPQKFSFELPMVLKMDFERRSNALLRGIGYFTVHHVPVDDFRPSILSIFHYKKSLKIMQILKILPNIPFKSKLTK